VDGLEQLLRFRLRFGRVAGGERAGDAVLDVLVEDLETETLERCGDGGALGEDVDAVAVGRDIFSIPRTCPSIRCRRLISASFCSW
jgi:hypothetical protein